MNFLKNLFSVAPGPEFKYYLPLIIIIGLLVVASIVMMQVYKNKKKNDFAFKRLFKNLARNLFLFALLFGFLILIRYENIPYFSMRVWLYLSALLFLYFSYVVIRTYQVDYPKEKGNKPKMFVRKEEAKYTAKKKKRK